jgi:hypothetical protein
MEYLVDVGILYMVIAVFSGGIYLFNKAFKNTSVEI